MRKADLFNAVTTCKHDLHPQEPGAAKGVFFSSWKYYSLLGLLNGEMAGMSLSPIKEPTLDAKVEPDPEKRRARNVRFLAAVLLRAVDAGAVIGDGPGVRGVEELGGARYRDALARLIEEFQEVKAAFHTPFSEPAPGETGEMRPIKKRHVAENFELRLQGFQTAEVTWGLRDTVDAALLDFFLYLNDFIGKRRLRECRHCGRWYYAGKRDSRSCSQKCANALVAAKSDKGHLDQLNRARVEKSRKKKKRI